MNKNKKIKPKKEDKEDKRVKEGNEKENVEELKKKISRLKRAAFFKDEFIRITTHDLRTPLDVIRGNLDMVIKGEAGDIPRDAKQYLKDALDGADRLMKIVNDMLQISQIETGRLRIILENVDVYRFLDTIVDNFSPLAKGRNITLHLECPQDIAHIYTDQSRLFQIIENLLGNALKFTPAGGSVMIRAYEDDETVVISVQDTGSGIRPEDQRKLFKRFPQIEHLDKETPKGTGLGLYLVRQFVMRLGGEVWAESAGINKGTTFSFRLPIMETKLAEDLKEKYAALAPKMQL